MIKSEKRIFSRFGVEAGFLPDMCLIASALVVILVRMSATSVSIVTPLALELTIVQFLIGAMCWGIRQYSIDSTRRGQLEFAALPRQNLLFTSVTVTLVLGYFLTIFLSPERDVNLYLLLVLAGNVALFFMVALFVVETIPLSRILAMTQLLFAGAVAAAFYLDLRSKTELTLLISITMGVGILFLALLSRRTGSSPSASKFLVFLARHPLFLVCGPLYLFGFWLDKWIYWFFIDNRTAEHSLWRPSASNMSGVLAVVFMIPALLVAFHAFRTEISRSYSKFSSLILGKSSLEEMEQAMEMVGKSVTTGLINTALTQLVFSAGLFFLAEELSEQLDPVIFTPPALKSAALGSVFFVVFSYLFRALLYFEDLRAAFISGISFCLGSVVFASGMMFFDVQLGGVGLGLAALLGILTSLIPLRRRMTELDYLFFTKY